MWKNVASLVKTRNQDGRLIAHAAVGLPFLLEVGMDVAFVPPQLDLPRSGVVVFMREMGNGSYEIEFDSVTEEVQARQLVGCSCLVKRSDINESLYEESLGTWFGYSVFDTQGMLIGSVCDLIENPGQSLLEIDRADEKGHAYIPLVDAIIIGVNIEQRTLVADLPKGILDL